ncbi:hypothetical protein M408DRAFT_251479 [Serendipita vermifera MAFF 305830]|uniref:Nephrocystin 3-like N-terminal domain-containing protein n=1 Tax=Serendipita vermifera MAFF 305830 TaxID=933852 RepID=A0A0C3AWU3_SERVB|nr:hypothetical protein M408DRAFT_251479 [Serendipita vermifera MAFF 305830]
MEGTRQDIIATILDWVIDADTPNIFWLNGHPGVGKSAIATSVIEELRKIGRLGSSFFFQREKSNAMTPSILWRTIAHDLALQNAYFRKSLVATLDANSSLLSTVSVENLFHGLIREPLMACSQMPIKDQPVIVIDALDECGGLDGQHSGHRINLIRTLKSWASLPNVFKLVVTSRGETDIEQLFSTIKHRAFEVNAGRAVDPKSLEDVKKFLLHRFRRIAARHEGVLPSDWPGDHKINELNVRGGGLFIYAETITNFLTRGEPEEQLSRIIGGTSTGNISTLYSWILDASFPSPSEKVIRGFRSFVGALILAKDPLSTSSLAHFCSADSSTMRYIRNGLHSVMEPGDIPRFKHQSFIDFLIDPISCPPAFQINMHHENRNLTLACLQIMKSQLRFNICGLKSSFGRNNDVPDLALRIQENIPQQLSYSACFWANHLSQTIFDDEVYEYILDFMQNRFLFWLEILSLIKRVNLGSNMARLLVSWLRASNKEDEMSIDMEIFMTAFGCVISQSVPHIYISALPLSPQNSAVRKQYIKDYPQTISIQSGGQGDWPAARNVLTGHTESVISVAFSPDGRHIVSGSRDETIRIWDVDTAELIAGSSKGDIWDLDTDGIAVGPSKSPVGEIISVAYSPNGKRIASGGENNQLWIWDAMTDEAVIGPLEGHNDDILSVAYSPDGKHIVSGSGDSTIRIWDAETGYLVAGPFEGHTNQVRSVAFFTQWKIHRLWFG